VTFELPQVNIARLLAPLDDPRLADFVAALEPVNELADRAPGFIWRLQTDEGNATAIRAFEWEAGDGPGVITNLSVWADADALAAFVHSEGHRRVLRRRREWFELLPEAWMALWWVPAGQRPNPADAEWRIRRLRAQGPTPDAFTLHHRFAPPIPIACSLSAADAHDQLDEWRALLGSEAVETRRVSPTELLFRLRADLARLEEIVRLAQREKACCPFFDFALRIEPDGVRLVVSVPEDGAPVLDAFAGLGR
jgi:heme-degrading monooxygenase HmoA